MDGMSYAANLGLEMMTNSVDDFSIGNAFKKKGCHFITCRHLPTYMIQIVSYNVHGILTSRKDEYLMYGIHTMSAIAMCAQKRFFFNC